MRRSHPPSPPLQLGECLRCLQHVAAQRLPMEDALRTLPALDALLRRLTVAAGEEVERRQAARAYLLPFTAAALESAFTVGRKAVVGWAWHMQHGGTSRGCKKPCR